MIDYARLKQVVTAAKAFGLVMEGPPPVSFEGVPEARPRRKAVVKSLCQVCGEVKKSDDHMCRPWESWMMTRRPPAGGDKPRKA